MDSRLRELERQAAQGDEEAQLRLHYTECRMGHHVLRNDQIIESEDIWRANNDVGGCQCGQKMFAAHELCEMGHHRLKEVASPTWGAMPTPLETLLGDMAERGYWCARLRPGVDAFSIATGTHQPSDNPLVGAMGCSFHYSQQESCKRGMHFLQRQAGGMYCANPDCDYIDPINCKKHQLSRPLYDNEGTEVSHCRHCWTVFTNLEICTAGIHRPDKDVGELCVRKGCDLFKGGMNLYEAMVATYQATGKLEAVCHINGRLVAKASGWNEKLKALGIKKPKLDPEKKPRIRSKLYKRFNSYSNRANTYSVKVQYTLTDPHLIHPQLYNWHMREKQIYSQINGKLKSFWSGHWYPVLESAEG